MKYEEWLFIKDFLSRGVSREVALQWASYWAGNPEGAFEWLSAGVLDPWNALTLNSLGIKPEHAKRWIEEYETYGMSKEEGERWFFFFYDRPEKVKEWYERGWKKAYKASLASKKYDSEQLERLLEPYTSLGVSKEDAFTLYENRGIDESILELCRDFKDIRLVQRVEGVSEEERKRLKEKVEKYISLGLTREVAEEMVLNEDLEQDSEEWIKIGLNEVSLIRAWKRAGWTPEKAKGWIEAGVWTPAQASGWEEMGMNPEDACKWISVSVENPYVAKKLEKEGISPESFSILCRTLRLTPSEVVDWLTQMELTEIRKWLKLGIDYHELAIELSLSGWQPEDVKKYKRKYGLDKFLRLAEKYGDKQSFEQYLAKTKLAKRFKI